MTRTAADTAAEPLISSHDAQSEQSEHEEEGSVEESDLVSPSLFIWILTGCAGISGLLFGYDTGVISSTLVSIHSDLSSRPLSTLDKSLITSSTSLFALLASPLTGILADHLGRKRVILLADVLFVVGALWQALTPSVWGMIGGRSVVGAAVGSASFVVPLYIGELSPSPFRGRLVVVSTLFITFGQVVAYLVGWAFSATPAGWRWMVGLGALPAVVQAALMATLPETPRWLVKAGKRDLAQKVLVSVYGGGGDESSVRLASKVLARVEKEVYEEEDGAGARAVPEPGKRGWSASLARLKDKFSQLVCVGGNRRALVIACMLQAFQQLCGFNSLMYFSATIFALVGFRSPTLTSLSIACTNFAFTLVAFWYIDRVGRRRILLYSIPVMIAGLALCAAAFSFLDLDPTPPSALAADAASSFPRATSPWPLVILAAMMLYVAGYAIGMGNVPWQQSELFPLSVRSTGSALATATNWGSNFVVGISFLPMLEVVTPAGTFACYALVCLGAWGVVWRIYPETVGLSLEDVGGLLGEGWGVRRRGGRARGRAR